MAASARRLPVDQALTLLRALLRRSEDLDDAYVAMLCWWVVEANLDRGRDEVLAMLSDAECGREPMVLKHILGRVMRGLALKGKNRDLQDCARLLDMADNKEQVDQLLSGFELAYAGRQITGLPNELAKALVESGRTSLSLRIRLGDNKAVGEALALLGDAKADTSQRVAMARALGEVQSDAAMSSLLNVATNAKNAKLQRVAMTSVSAFDEAMIADRLLDGFPTYSDDVLSAFFDLMLSRVSRTRRLLDAVSGGQIDPSDVPADVIDQLRRHSDSTIVSAAVKLFGAGQDFEPDRVKQHISQLRTILGEGSGNPYAGEELFMQKCAACHKLFHKGGNVGPDLTPYQRGNLDTLLRSVVDPSAEIREGFEQTQIVTTDGRILTGFVVDQDTQIVTLRSKSGENIRVTREDVESLNAVRKSLMPDGLLQDMTDQQLRDFFAFLRISQPISH